MLHVVNTNPAVFNIFGRRPDQLLSLDDMTESFHACRRKPMELTLEMTRDDHSDVILVM